MKIPGGPKLKLIKAKTVKEKGVMVCTPTYRGMPTKQTFQCTREAMRHMAGLGYNVMYSGCLLYTSPSPRDGLLSRMPSSA